VWHILLESSQQRLQLCFKPHFNWRSAQKVMGLKSCKSPNFKYFENFLDSQLESPKTKWYLDVGFVAMHKKYYNGEGDGFPPSLSCGEFCESMFARGSFMQQKCSNYALTNLLFGLCKSMWIIDTFVTHPNPHPETPARLTTPNVVSQRAYPNPLSFCCFHLGLVIESIRELGGASIEFH